MKKTIIVCVVLAIAGLGAFRAAQVISAKREDPKKSNLGQAPLVEVAPATRGLVEEKIIRNGDIAPYAQVTLFSKSQGWVEKINVREGDRVKVGQVLATLDAREAEAAVAQVEANLESTRARLNQVRDTAEQAVQSQIQQTKATMDFAESDLKRFQELHEKNFISRQQLDDARTKFNVSKAAYDLAQNSIKKKVWENDIALAEAQVRQAKASLDLSKAQLNNLVILSPMNGGVTKRHVDPGTMVKDTTPILTLMDLGELKMVVNVIEREFVRLQKGQPVSIAVTAFPNRTFPGRIVIINPSLDLQSRTAEIQISIPNPGYVLNPGMFGRVEITMRSNPEATLIPIQSLVTQEDKDYVFIYKDGKVHRRAIQKGLVRDTTVEVAKGVNAGDQVVVAGYGSLKDGMNVRLLPKTEQKG